MSGKINITNNSGNIHINNGGGRRRNRNKGSDPSGCLGIIVAVIAIGFAIKFWFIVLPVVAFIAIGITWWKYEQRREVNKPAKTPAAVKPRKNSVVPELEEQVRESELRNKIAALDREFYKDDKPDVLGMPVPGGKPARKPDYYFAYNEDDGWKCSHHHGMKFDATLCLNREIARRAKEAKS